MRRLLFVLTFAACHSAAPKAADLGAAPVARDASTAVASFPSASLPAATLMGLDGKTVDLASVRKKVTFVAAWGTFCAPCLEELPLVQKLYEAKKNDPDVAIFAVSVDDVDSAPARAKVAAAAKKLGLTFPVYGDVDHVFTQHYIGRSDPDNADAGVQMGLPTALLLHESGKMFHEEGYNPSGAGSYVADHVKMIDDAKGGVLPAEPKLGSAGLGADEMPDEITLPAIDKADFAKRWPNVELMLRHAMHASDATIADAKRQAKTGAPITVKLKK